MENIEAITVSDRRVAEVTFSGSSSESSNTPKSLLTIDACVAQLSAAIRTLNVPTVHVVAHGLGAPVALALLRKQPESVRSLALVCPFGSLIDLQPAAAEALSSSRDGTSAATMLLQTKTLRAKNSCVREAKDASGGPLLPQLLSGAGETSSLGGEALAKALGGIEVPVFLAVGSAADLVEPNWVDLPASVTRRDFALSGNMPFIDQREDFLVAYTNFLDAADGVATNRELKFADPITTLKELTSDRPLAAPPKDCSTFKTEAARAYCEKNK
eukprot:scaffold49701_cov33-Tisochrysis_lutea.AAC.7